MSSATDSAALEDAYVGIGSNLDDPIRQVREAFQELDEIAETRCVARSSLYRSAPMGPSDQPDYVNAAVALRTGLSARRLLDALLAIEQSHGRIRGGRRWGPRTLDLDLLLFGNQCIAEPGLTVPHPGIASRGFVVYPLLEIAPHLDVPGVAPLVELASFNLSEGLVRLDAGR